MMRIWAALFCAASFVAMTASCDAQQPRSQEQFRDAVAQELAHQRPDLCVRARSDTELGVGRSAQHCAEVLVSTAYTYGQYEADPSREAFHVAQLVTTALNGVAALDETAFTPVRDQIVALVRPTDYARTFGPPGEPTSSIWRPFVGDFIAVLAHDEETQERSLRGIDIQTLGLSEAQAWELAFENLRRRIGPLAREANSFGAEVVTAPSGLAPASLLLPETCSSVGPSFDVYIVTRDTFFYADANKPQASGMLAGHAAQLLQSGDNIYSERLLSCLDGAWYASVFNGINAWTPEQPNAN